jgi:hypothetical protein
MVSRLCHFEPFIWKVEDCGNFDNLICGVHGGCWLREELTPQFDSGQYLFSSFFTLFSPRPAIIALFKSVHNFGVIRNRLGFAGVFDFVRDPLGLRHVPSRAQIAQLGRVLRLQPHRDRFAGSVAGLAPSAWS